MQNIGNIKTHLNNLVKLNIKKYLIKPNITLKFYYLENKKTKYVSNKLQQAPTSSLTMD